MRQPGTRADKHKEAAPTPPPTSSTVSPRFRGDGGGQEDRVYGRPVALRRLPQAYPAVKQSVLADIVPI